MYKYTYSMYHKLVFFFFSSSIVIVWNKTNINPDWYFNTWRIITNISQTHTELYFPFYLTHLLFIIVSVSFSSFQFLSIIQFQTPIHSFLLFFLLLASCSKLNIILVCSFDVKWWDELRQLQKRKENDH